MESASIICLRERLSCALGAVPATPGVAQYAGVDNTRMGAYRAPAQLSYQAFHKEALATAAKLARILEKTWDAAEERGGERSRGKANPELFEHLDEAMDTDIKPIMQHGAKSPDRVAVQAAYEAFLDKLKQAG